MTVIVGVADGTRVVMGADGVATSYESGDVFRSKLNKVVRKADRWGGEILIGVSGSLPHLRAIEAMPFGDQPPPIGKVDQIDWMAKRIWHKWRSDWDMFRSLNPEFAHCRSGCQLIVGWEGEVYLLDTDGTVSQDQADYLCIGSGEDPARGAMFATSAAHGLGRPCGGSRHGHFEMDERVLIALHASHYHRSAIQPPFQIETLDPPPT